MLQHILATDRSGLQLLSSRKRKLNEVTNETDLWMKYAFILYMYMRLKHKHNR